MSTVKHTTLLDLIQTVSACARSDAEVVATVASLVNSGTVRLCGIFAGAHIDLATLPDLPRQRTSEYEGIRHVKRSGSSRVDRDSPLTFR